MRFSLAVTAAVLFLAACGTTHTAQCRAAGHQDGSAAFERCVKIKQAAILNKPGTAAAKSRRGGPG